MTIFTCIRVHVQYFNTGLDSFVAGYNETGFVSKTYCKVRKKYIFEVSMEKLKF